MLATRRRDTRCELKLRRQLHAIGLRYRVDRAVLAGVRRRVDIVFSSAQVAVFVDGCFWHRCPEHSSSPKSNSAWWQAKLDANQARDADTNRRLSEAGWTVVHVWEHDDPAVAAARIAQLVRGAGTS